MPSYKRNQVEEAITAVLGSKSEIRASELRTRLKRLLETDRARGRNSRSAEPGDANFAFYSAEPPGSGVEIWFSDYEAFALLTGLNLMAHNWPQGFAVSVMRRVRPKLEKEHARILRQDAEELFDQEEIRRSARPGDMVFNLTDPLLLTIVSRSGSVRDQESEPEACAICRGPDEAMKFWKQSGGAGGVTIFELAGNAHVLAQALKKTEPIPRGRT